MFSETVLALTLLGIGTGLRQIDRAWFSPYRDGFRIRVRAKSLAAGNLMRLQSQRSNRLTPVLLLVGQWTEICGWWLLAGKSWWFAGLVTVAIAIKFRHLQEITHLAVHGGLSGRRKFDRVLAEVFFQAPLALASFEQRHQRHVTEHHPNATLRPEDPNMAEVAAVGLMARRVTAGALLRAVLHPLAPSQVAKEAKSIAVALWRARFLALHDNFFVILVPIVASFALGGWAALIFGYIVPRVMLYPLLAWASQLVEHRWRVGKLRPGRLPALEFQRCIRLYPKTGPAQLLTRSTWLPYGDLYHYAHSVYPRLRWNYLPAADRMLGLPATRCNGLVFSNPSWVNLYLKDVRQRKAGRPAVDARRESSETLDASSMNLRRQ